MDTEKRKLPLLIKIILWIAAVLIGIINLKYWS
jgi:hypothetical protein